MPTSHPVSPALFMYACSDSAVLFCHVLAYAITANGVRLHLLVPSPLYCGLNSWMYFQEKSILCNNFVGLFSRVDIFSQDIQDFVVFQELWSEIYSRKYWQGIRYAELARSLWQCSSSPKATYAG